MKIAIISFTNNGTRINKEISIYLKSKDISCQCFSNEKYATNYDVNPLKESIYQWTKRVFSEVDGIVFVGAVGIAVRAIAPCILDKTKDPAVVVVDEQGNYAISLLSGHIGGANELTIEVAKAVNAVPIISTATDMNHKFAVDIFAKRNSLYIEEMKTAKEITASVLDDEEIGLSIDDNIKIIGKIPPQVKSESNKGIKKGLYIGIYNHKPFETTLSLVPKIVTIGLGCRRDTPYEQIKNRILRVLSANGIHFSAIEQMASIDLKSNEPGLLEFAKEYSLPIAFFGKKELEAIKGDFNDSAFVKSITGVGNVCERAAVLASGGELIQDKDASDNVTIALAVKEWSVEFE